MKIVKSGIGSNIAGYYVLISTAKEGDLYLDYEVYGIPWKLFNAANPTEHCIPERKIDWVNMPSNSETVSSIYAIMANGDELILDRFT